MTMFVETNGGFLKRLIASHKTAPMATIKKTALANAANIEELRKPKVYLSLGLRRIKTLAIHAMLRGLRAKSADARDALVDEARALAARWPCDDPRFALRLLQRAVNVLAETSQPIEAPLVVRREGRAFRLPGATEDVALERRIPLARILHALARRRIESPGEAMRVEELLAAGWPAEKVRYDAGANRVYVALAELRKRGLREFIESGAEGYRLATSRSVVLDGSPHGR